MVAIYGCLLGERGPRADQGHIADKNVEMLGYLIQGPAAQPAAQFGDTWVLADFEERAVILPVDDAAIGPKAQAAASSASRPARSADSWHTDHHRPRLRRRLSLVPLAPSPPAPRQTSHYQRSHARYNYEFPGDVDAYKLR